MMNKKGSLFDIFVFLIVTFIVFIFFAAVIYGFGLLSNEITGIILPEESNIGNVTEAAENTFGAINNALPALRWIAFVIVIAMIIGIMVSNFLVKAHPVFFIVYILFTFMAVIFSVYLSNAYESILTSGNVLAPTLQSFGAMDYIMLNLPIWAAIVGIMGSIFLFIGITVDRQQGGSIPI